MTTNTTNRWSDAVNAYRDQAATGEPSPAAEPDPSRREVEAAQLELLDWNELRQFAKGIGVPARGGRAALTAAVLDAVLEAD